MKVLFLNPLKFTERFNIATNLINAYISTPSLTFAQLASYIPGKEITVIDGQVEDTSPKEFLHKLGRVDLVVISIHSTYAAKNCEANIKIIKKYYPRIKIIMGGYHATFFYERWLKLGADFVLLYEGERYFGELVECLDKNKDYRGIKNLVYEDNGKIIVNEIGPLINNLDSIPIPRFDIINFKKYSAFFPGDSYAGGIELSRGCLYRCEFCLTSTFWNNCFRRKSNQRILKELRLLVDMNVRKIWFYTASFGMLPEEDYALCDLIEKSGIKVSWRAPIRIDTVLRFPGLLEKSAHAGLRSVLIGYESMLKDATSDAVLAEFNKIKDLEYNFSAFKEAYHILKKNNILVEGSFITGYSEKLEKKESLSSVKFNQVCDVLLVQVYRPNVVLFPEILSNGSESADYKKLFYFDAQGSDDFKVRRAFFKKIRMQIYYYFNPFYIYSRLFLKGGLVRRLYLLYYGHLIKNLFRKFTVTAVSRNNIEFDRLTEGK